MNGLRDQFITLYDEHAGSIFRFCFLKTGSRETAEDLAAEVFVRLWDAMRREAGKTAPRGIGSPRAYIYKIARNVVADYYRGARIRTVELEEGMLPPSPEKSAEEAADLNLETDRIRRALSHLREDYQNYVIWRYLDEMSVREISHLTGKTEESVRVGIHRALQALKAKLGEV